jgi:arginase
MLADLRSVVRRAEAFGDAEASHVHVVAARVPPPTGRHLGAAVRGCPNADGAGAADRGVTLWLEGFTASTSSSRITLVSAPTNLGLKPPEPTSVPGTAKAPEALRNAGLHRVLVEMGADDFGVVLPGRYVDRVVPGAVRNQAEIVAHARRLANVLASLWDEGRVPLVLGGDCSLLAGVGVALASIGRYGLIHLDGHTDFRHPDNSPECASLAGEDLAMAVGSHWPAVADIDNQGPYFEAGRVVHAGCRDDDEHLAEVRGRLGLVRTVSELRAEGPDASAARFLEALTGAVGYWIHVDMDILDPSVLPAVDSPSPGGLDARELIALLRKLAPGAAGADVTIYDPDLDPGGAGARLVADIIARGLSGLGAGRE